MSSGKNPRQTTPLLPRPRPACRDIGLATQRRFPSPIPYGVCRESEGESPLPVWQAFLTFASAAEVETAGQEALRVSHVSDVEVLYPLSIRAHPGSYRERIVQMLKVL